MGNSQAYPGILSAIAGGNPFAQSLTRWDSGNTNSVFRTITGMSGAAWINEGDVKPTVSIETEGVLVKAEELAGIPMLSDRMIRDSRTDIVAEVERVMRECRCESLVYDRAEVFWVVAEDFTITPSRDYAPAYEQDSIALRTSGQFGVGVPNHTKAIRQVTVTA